MGKLFVNDDFCAFEQSGFENMNVAGVEDQIRFYANGADAILFNLNAQRTYFESKVWTCAWEDITDGDDGKLYYNGKAVENIHPEPALDTFIRNSRELNRNVPDLFALRYRLCRKYGVEMWHSVRMNDVHWTPDESLPHHSRFWKEHPEFRRAAYRKGLSSIWDDQALDFSHPEVRDYTFALIAEYLEKECDGIELDFLRSYPYFLPGGSDAGRPLMTELMRRIKAETEKAEARFGHPVPILVRVAPDPAENLNHGLDVQRWAAEGLCRIVAPCAPQPYATDSTIPVELWKQLLPENITVMPGIDTGLMSSWNVKLRSSKETDAGMAAAYYYRGADGIYLYNHFYSGCGYTKREEQKIAYGFLGNREKTEARTRRVPAVFKSSVLPGHHGMTSFFPTAWKGSGIYNEIDIGGGTAGRTGCVLICSRNPMPGVEVRLNTIVCERADDARPPDWELPAGLKYFAFFRVPAGVLHDGMNGIDVINRSVEADFELNWVELDLV